MSLSYIQLLGQLCINWMVWWLSLFQLSISSDLKKNLSPHEFSQSISCWRNPLLGQTSRPSFTFNFTVTTIIWPDPDPWVNRHLTYITLIGCLIIQYGPLARLKIQINFLHPPIWLGTQQTINYHEDLDNSLGKGQAFMLNQVGQHYCRRPVMIFCQVHRNEFIWSDGASG